jgi:hypothetical protein
MVGSSAFLSIPAALNRLPLPMTAVTMGQG